MIAEICGGDTVGCAGPRRARELRVEAFTAGGTGRLAYDFVDEDGRFYEARDVVVSEWCAPVPVCRRP